MRPSDLDAHVSELCVQHGIHRADGRGRAVSIRAVHAGGRVERRLEIRVPAVRGQVTYLVALHEIGHLVGDGRSGRRLEKEAAAWRFALRESLVEPTAATRRRVGRRLRSYVTWAEQRRRRRNPPHIPSAGDPFWALLAWLEA